MLGVGAAGAVLRLRLQRVVVVVVVAVVVVHLLVGVLAGGGGGAVAPACVGGGVRQEGVDVEVLRGRGGVLREVGGVRVVAAGLHVAAVVEQHLEAGFKPRHTLAGGVVAVVLRPLTACFFFSFSFLQRLLSWVNVADSI